MLPSGTAIDGCNSNGNGNGNPSVKSLSFGILAGGFPRDDGVAAAVVVGVGVVVVLLVGFGVDVVEVPTGGDFSSRRFLLFSSLTRRSVISVSVIAWNPDLPHTSSMRAASGARLVGSLVFLGGIRPLIGVFPFPEGGDAISFIWASWKY